MENWFRRGFRGRTAATAGEKVKRVYDKLVPLSRKRLTRHLNAVCYKCGVALFEGDLILPHRAGSNGHHTRIYCEACKDLWL